MPQKTAEEEKVVLLPSAEARGLREAVARLMGDEVDEIETEAEEVESFEQSAETNSRSTEQIATVHSLSLESISYNRFQTRDFVEDGDIEGLAQSISQRGIIQPIVVRRMPEGSGTYELVAGERRLRAAKIAGLNQIPALVAELSDLEAVELSVIENAQREDLNPVEEAQSYKILSDQFGLKHAEIAEVIGKSRTAISNALRLLQLEVEVLELLKTGELSAGHGRALLALKDPNLQCRIAFRAVNRGLSVRALEDLVSRASLTEDYEPDEEELREQASLERAKTKVQNLLGMEQVRLTRDKEGRRRVNITFETEAEWRRFLAKIRD